jgi:hypothetical protein
LPTGPETPKRARGNAWQRACIHGAPRSPQPQPHSRPSFLGEAGRALNADPVPRDPDFRGDTDKEYRQLFSRIVNLVQG